MDPLSVTFTDQFIEPYQALDDDCALVVDGVIQRIQVEHESAWARRNRIAGDAGSAWLIEARCQDSDIRLYSRYGRDGNLEVVLLLAG